MANVTITSPNDEYTVGDLFMATANDSNRSRLCMLCSNVDEDSFFLVYLDTGKRWNTHRNLKSIFTSLKDFTVIPFNGVINLTNV